MAITIPNTFVAGTKIEATPMNANFAETANAVDKRGDTLAGNLGANAGITVDGVDVSTIPNTSGTFNPLFAQVVIGTADTNGIRLDLESGTLAVREGDDSAYGPLTSGLLTTSGNHVPATNDGGSLGISGTAWADLFLASGAVINFNAGDVTVTHSSNTLTFAGAASGYIFNDGNVGIGTASPNKIGFARALTIESSGQTGIEIVGSQTTDAAIGNLNWINAAASNANMGQISTRRDGADNSGALTFSTWNGGSGAERMRITAAGNVGINTTSPSARLHVNGTAGTTTAFFNQATSGKTGIILADNGVARGYLSEVGLYSGNSDGNFGIFVETGYNFQIATNGSVTSKFTVHTGGNIAIGATARFYLDGVAGTGDTYIHESSANRMAFVVGGTELFVINSAVSLALAKENLGIEAAKKFYLDGGSDTYIEEYAANEVRLTVGGAAHSAFNSTGQFVYYNPPTTASAANAYIAQTDYIRRSTSSIRYKHDIGTLDGSDALAAVMAMRPVTYRGKTDDDQRRFVGFIAEEMQEIAPLLCTYDEGGESGTPNYVTYDRVTAYLVAVVQQQQQKIAALEARIH
jgi:hypothetical protein